MSEENYKDYIVRGTAAEDQIRFFAATTRNIAERGRQIHNTSPIATAALGRLMTGAVMMASMMKSEKDILTLIIRGDGPMGGLTVTCDSMARVKGYVINGNVILPANEFKHLNVGGGIGKGYLQVIKDIGMKDPYVGQVNLVSGEIAEDLTVYFATSEQVPSAVGLGVLMSMDNTVKQAGGFIIQVMPFASEETIAQLEKKLTQVTDISELLDEGMSPEEIIDFVMEGMEPQVLERIEPQYYCNCSKERTAKAIISIGKKDLQEMIDDGKDVEVNCHFCGSKYKFTPDELKVLLGE